jgi:hypothetical protein
MLDQVALALVTGRGPHIALALRIRSMIFAIVDNAKMTQSVDASK